MNLEELFELIKNEINLKNENDKNKNKNKNKNDKNIKYLYSILRDYNKTDWKKYIKLNSETYNKTFINGNKDFDMYIITWNKYQESKIHDHSTNVCIYKILKGHIIEEAYDKNLKITGVRSLFKNSIGCIDDYFQLHKMCNHSNSIAVSLHIYSPSNHKTVYYDDITEDS
jgi:hypothetical protein